jgi:hypothetical protein
VKVENTFFVILIVQFLTNISIVLTTIAASGLGVLVVSVLASGTQDRGFVPGRSRRIFQVKKSSACLPSEGK